jgi:hypothetical protein
MPSGLARRAASIKVAIIWQWKGYIAANCHILFSDGGGALVDIAQPSHYVALLHKWAEGIHLVYPA